MESIYPTMEESKEVVVLSAEEILALKKGLVLARVKKIEHPQDRALDALYGAAFLPARAEQIRSILQTVMDLEASVLEEGRALKATVEASYKPGDTPTKVETYINSDLVDKTVYAEMLVQLKTTGIITTPVIKTAAPIEVVEILIEK